MSDKPQIQGAGCGDLLGRFSIRPLILVAEKYVEDAVDEPAQFWGLYRRYRYGRISIESWPAGSHYYATVDGKDVQDAAGNVKWETYEDAVNAARAYMAKLDLPNIRSQTAATNAAK